MKKFIILPILCSLLFAACPALPAQAEEQTAEKYVDVYILAGQSNAVGCSNLEQIAAGETESYRTLLTAEDARNRDGYENVYQYSAVNLSPDAALPDPAFRPVAMDMGQSAGYSGPELGMANILSEQASEDRPALIIKLAAGGVLLGDYNGAAGYYPFTDMYGNWASPTMIARWEQEGKRIHRYTGLLYERLLTFVDQAFARLRTEGYTPVVQGYLWMQGESDAENGQLAEAYAQNLTEFITDLRGDIAELAQDESAAYRPFVIGKITPTYNGIVRYVNILRENQELAARSVPFAYTVETDDLPVYDPETDTVCGSDICHFNAADIYTLGKRFANTVLDHTAQYHVYVQVEGTGGSVTECNYQSDGETMQIAYTTEEGYTLTSALLNGEEIAASDGTIEITPQEGDEPYRILTLTFAAEAEELPDEETPGGEETTENEDTEGGLPTWAIVLIVIGIAAVFAAITALFLFRRKQN